MRGQAGAVYLTIVNILGLGIGPTATAAMSDYMFDGPADIGKALAATTIVASGFSSLLLILGLPRVRKRAGTVLDTLIR